MYCAGRPSIGCAMIPNERIGSVLSTAEQLHIIESGVDQITPEADLAKKLDTGMPLTIKLGVDPTAPDLHLGHAVPLRKMRQFQDMGHRVVLIIGDGTALIGDPSGRNSTRPPLSREQIKANASTYVEQAMKILDPEKTSLRWNSEWLLSLDLEGLLKLASKFTVARILERDDFSNRYKAQEPIAMHEFLYPIMQAYDSVIIEADVEMGGRDQLFNLLAGRELMEKLGMEPQIALTLPLLEGLDGVRKMSKSYGNYIGLTDTPEDMFGKVMSIPDELMVKYFRLASTVSVDEADAIEVGLADGSLHPNKVKRRLAANIVALYHDEGAAAAAEEAFDRVFKEHVAPTDIPLAHVALIEDAEKGGVYLPALLAQIKLATSSTDARHLIDGGGVKVAGETVEPHVYFLPATQLAGVTLQVGKRKFVRLVIA